MSGAKKLKYEVHATSNYITLFLGEKKNTEGRFEGKVVAYLVALLTNEENKEFKVETLKELRKPEGKELLMQTIAENKKHPKLKYLVAACWEAGLDFSKDIPFFIDLAVSCDYDVCLEVLTVIEDASAGTDKRKAEESIHKLEAEISKEGNAKNSLYSEIIEILKNKM